jgi:hypothetical protein
MIIDDVPDDPLDTWAPTHAESARAGELWQQCLTDHAAFDATFTAVCDDVLLERNLPRVLAAILLHGRALIDGNCGDPQLARARLAADTASARADAVREAIYRDD